MEFNSLIFPAPASSYTQYDLEQVIFIPRIKKFEQQKKFYQNVASNSQKFSSDIQKIPCLFLPYTQRNYKSNTLLLFFHGNAEDIGQASEFLSCIREQLIVNVIAVEYPGYGIYSGTPNAQTICEDAIIVYNFLTKLIGFPQKNIIVFGRSIGTGPAMYLASKKQYYFFFNSKKIQETINILNFYAIQRPASVMLMSPFSSFKEVVKSLVGSMLSHLVQDRFKNIEEVEKIRCPLFLLHGKKDRLVPVEHSKQLYEKCMQEQIECDFWFPSQMTHNTYNMLIDILIPIDNFLSKYNYKIRMQANVPLEFPLSYTRLDQIELQNINLQGQNQTPQKGFFVKLYEKLFGNNIDE